MKAGFRHGDNAAMAVIEFVDRDDPPRVPATAPARGRAAPRSARRAAHVGSKGRAPFAGAERAKRAAGLLARQAPMMLHDLSKRPRGTRGRPDRCGAAELRCSRPCIARANHVEVAAADRGGADVNAKDNIRTRRSSMPGGGRNEILADPATGAQPRDTNRYATCLIRSHHGHPETVRSARPTSTSTTSTTRLDRLIEAFLGDGGPSSGDRRLLVDAGARHPDRDGMTPCACPRAWFDDRHR